MSPSPYAQQDGPSGLPPSTNSISPTTAAFSPTDISGSSLTSKQRSTIIVHRKSPLLVATPPAVTRALAYSHPFLLPLNRLVGLLSWTTGDPWESFLLLAAFWTTALYGNVIVLWAGPVLVVVGLMLGMYSRRYSPLSSTGLTGEKHGHRKQASEVAPHHKTLDEVVETLREFTTRCNILLEPLVELTDFLSTQRTATSATTRPALTALLTRILFVTPIWILLTLPPFRLITTRRVVVGVGTIIMTWHSKPARISRVILWRSLTVRRICSIITGLQFSLAPDDGGDRDWSSPSKFSFFPFRPFRSRPTEKGATNIAPKKRRSGSPGVRFTFILYENQRRWLGIGWTTSLFAYERAAWTDEHLNPAPSKDEFELPDVKGGTARWRWVSGSEWRIDNVLPDPKAKKSNQGCNGKGDDGGWIYYDNKWNDGRRGQDSWNRYTRRRKWCRDAELVEMTPSTESTPPSTPPPETNLSSSPSIERKQNEDDGKNSLKQRTRRWFGNNESTKQLSPSPPADAAASLPNLSSNSLSTALSEDNKSPGKPPSTISSRSAPYPRSLRNASFDGGSGRNSIGGRRSSRAASGTVDADRESLTLSVRERELEEAENTVDRWDTRPGGAAERAERAWGLGDDAHMGLS